MKGVDPFAWLAQVLQRVAAGWANRDLDQLLLAGRPTEKLVRSFAIVMG